MDKITQTDQEVAKQALSDSTFAQKILTGEIDSPNVRNAILADLYSSSAEAEPADRGARLFDARTVDVRELAERPMGPCYVRYYPKLPALGVWEEWGTLPKTNLTDLANR